MCEALCKRCAAENRYLQLLQTFDVLWNHSIKINELSCQAKLLRFLTNIVSVGDDDVC